MATSRVPAALVAGVLFVLAGCGKGPSPTAPKTPVDDALSALSLKCGRAVQARTFGGTGSTVARLDRGALGDAARLIRIYWQDPAATYLGQTMSSVLSTEASAARSCGLARTASRISAAAH